MNDYNEFFYYADISNPFNALTRLVGRQDGHPATG